MKLTTYPHASGTARTRGFSLVELMISITISLLILAGLSAMLVNVSRNNAEMAKSNSQIENGRFAIQVLENDIVHAGFWGEYIPQFDDVSWMFAASDAPTVAPDPCRAYLADDHDSATATDWDFGYLNGLFGIPIQAWDAVPAGCTLPNKADATDVLLVRHAATCISGEANCDAADTTGKLYLQTSMCATATWGTTLVGSTTTTIKLMSPSSTSNTSAIVDAYNGMTIRILSGALAGQTRTISAYGGTSYTATVSQPFATAPLDGVEYTIVDEVLSTTDFPLRKRSCLSTAPAAKRQFESHIYYIRDYASSAGDGIPTLMRSSFDLAGGVLAHQAPEPLVEGVQRFAVELGIDNLVKRCSPATPVSASGVVVRVDPATCAANAVTTLNTLPTNRGDGSADEFIRCTTALPCPADKLRNAVAAKLYLLVRSTETTRGYTDTKTYCMASIPPNGTCPAGSLAGPFNDGYKRHLFSSTIRLTSISGRRETP